MDCILDGIKSLSANRGICNDTGARGGRPRREACVSTVEHQFPEHQMELSRSRASRTKRSTKTFYDEDSSGMSGDSSSGSWGRVPLAAQSIPSRWYRSLSHRATTIFPLTCSFGLSPNSERPEYIVDVAPIVEH